jgi:hypothetical protein
MMSQVIVLCSDSEDDGEWPNKNTASVPSLPISRKRPRDKEDSSPAAHPYNENGHGKNTATGSAEFVVDLELAPHKKRRGVRSGKIDAAGDCAQIMKGVHATENDVCIRDAQVADHRESHEGVAAAASRPVNSDSEQTSRNDGSTNKHSHKLPASKPPLYASGHQRKNLPVAAVAGEAQQAVNEEDFTTNSSLDRDLPINIKDRDGASEESLPYQAVDWAKRFEELNEYRLGKRPFAFLCQNPEYAKLSKWVFSQRCEYRRMVEGKDTILILERVKDLDHIGSVWKTRLSELADYRKIHGHCNVPYKYSENCKLANWVGTQRTQYTLHLEGKKSQITSFRIQTLESLGFEWDSRVTLWEDRLSELADYRKMHGDCNVPRRYSENTKLGMWVMTQRSNYRLHLEGKKSSMTLPRIHELESLGFRWGSSQGTAIWEDHLSELADYRKIKGHCNVPQNYSENTKLANWVSNQRCQHRFYQEGKKSSLTLPRIRELESLGFEWNGCIGRKIETSKKSSLADDATCVREKAVEAPEHTQQPHSLKKTSAVEKSAAIMSTSLPNPKSPTGMAKSTSTSSRVEAQNIKCVVARDAPIDETDLDGSLSESSAAPSLYIDRRATKSLSPEKPDTAGGSMESNTRKDALQAKLPGLAQQKKRITSFSHALLAASPPENEFLVATLKPANSRQRKEGPLRHAFYKPDAAEHVAQSSKGYLCPTSNPADIAPAPVTSNHVVESEETKMVCKIIKRGQEGEEDKSIGFVVLKSRTKSFVDARQAIVDQGVPINIDYVFCVPHLGPISVMQESMVGPMLAFLETCTSSADLGDGSFANPVKVFLVGAPVL